MIKTLQEAKDYFESQNCELLEDNYVNAHTKMRYRCGNQSTINLNNFKSGKRCGCGRVGVNRHTAAEIKSETEARGFQYISSEYINDKHMVTCVCKCGAEKTCEFRSLRKSEGCSSCRNKNLKLDFDYVKDFFTKEGCELLETEYKNARTKMSYRCSCGEIAKIIFDSFRRGNRCKKCAGDKISKKTKGELHPNWNKDRQQAKTNLQFRKKCCSLLKNVIKRLKIKKNNKTTMTLGYNSQEWHIDHIFPVKAFIDYGIMDLKIINGLDNLQPLSAKDNFNKHAKYDLKLFEDWLKTKTLSMSKIK